LERLVEPLSDLRLTVVPISFPPVSELGYLAVSSESGEDGENENGHTASPRSTSTLGAPKSCTCNAGSGEE
jgi:hypothetical protein